MVINGIMTIDEMISKIRKFLRSLSIDRIRNLSREDFAKVLGMDPRELPPDYKAQIAKVLYEEFNLPYRWIADKLAMSLRDISRAVRGVNGQSIRKHVSSTKIEVEVIARAIELVREGKIRNPNDLILELKVDLEQAKYLFNTIMENERIITTSTVEAVRRIERSLKNISGYSHRIGEIDKNVKEGIEEYEKRTKKIVEELKKEVEYFQKYKDEVIKDSLELQIMLGDLGIKTKTVLEFAKNVQSLKENVGKFEEDISSKISTLNAKIIGLSNRVANLEDKFREFGSLKSRLEELLNALVTCKDAIPILVQENKRLLEENKKLREEVKELAKRKENLETQIEDLKAIRERVMKEGKIYGYKTPDGKEVIYIPAQVKKYILKDGTIREEYEYPFIM
jgi:chromosome segregation ATPase